MHKAIAILLFSDVLEYDFAGLLAVILVYSDSLCIQFTGWPPSYLLCIVLVDVSQPQLIYL